MEVSDERQNDSEKKGGVGNFFKKIKQIKNFRIIAVIFIIAIALIIYSTVITNKPDKAQTAVSTVMTQDEQRLSSILAGIEGAGSVESMITERDGEIVGVLVIAEGADDITVRIRLVSAAATALGVDKSVVNVYSKK